MDHRRFRNLLAARIAAPWIAAILLAIGLSPGADAAECEMARLLASDGAAYDYFGHSVAVSGDVAVVGAYQDDDYGPESGSAWVYRWNGSSWVEEAKLLPSDGGASTDFFGFRVAVSGNVSVVGKHLDDESGFNSGSAYVYRFDGSTWAETKLLASDGVFGDSFGWSVAVSGDVAVVGAYGDDDNGLESGAAYVYRWNGSSWVEDIKLLASDGAADDNFGYAVAVSGDVVVVGAWHNDDNGADSGSAYVYRWNGSSWIETKLLASDGAVGDWFGFSVAVSGDVAMVGSFLDDDNGPDSGSAYAYRFNSSSWTWAETKLLASDGAAGDYFGFSVAVSGDVAVVGAYQNDDDGVNSGSAYVYRFDGSSWAETKLLASDGTVSDWFGYSVGVSGDVAVVGAYGVDDNGPSSGSAYVHGGVSAADCNTNGEGDLCDILAGTSSDLDVSLTPDECDSFAYNRTLAIFHDTIADAIGAAASGDDLVASPLLFDTEPDIDFEDRAITLASFSAIDQAPGGLIVLADGARLETAAGADMTLGGELRAKAGDTADVQANQLTVAATGKLVCRESSNLDVAATDGLLGGVTRVHALGMLVFGGPVEQSGAMTVFPGATFVADDTLINSGSSTVLDGGLISTNGAVTNSGSLIIDAGELNTNSSLDVTAIGAMTLNASDLFVTGTCSNAGTLNLLDGLMIAGPVTTTGVLGLSSSTVFADGLSIGVGGRLNTSGEIYSDVTNDQDVYCLGDTIVVGTYTNNGTTTVQIGTLTIVGTLINNGTIIGNVVGGMAAGADGTLPGDGLSIAEDYVAGAGAALVMADPVWVFEVGGNYDVAIDDNTRYHMVQAELRMTGAWQSLELMSMDIGPDQAGLDRTSAGHYPIGTLRMESGATVDLVDVHDNDNLGQALREAIYVQQLVIEAGAVLNTLGTPVYYDTAIVDGAVDDPANLIPLPPPCVWDCESVPDGAVSINDFLALLAQWATPGSCDFDGDGVGINDFLALLAMWGPCP